MFGSQGTAINDNPGKDRDFSAHPKTQTPTHQTTYAFARQIDVRTGSSFQPISRNALAGFLDILIKWRELDCRSDAPRPKHLGRDLPDPFGLLGVDDRANQHYPE